MLIYFRVMWAYLYLKPLRWEIRSFDTHFWGKFKVMVSFLFLENILPCLLWILISEIWISQFWYHYPWHLSMVASLLLPAPPSPNIGKGKTVPIKKKDNGDNLSFSCIMSQLSYLENQEHGVGMRAPTHFRLLRTKILCHTLLKTDLLKPAESPKLYVTKFCANHMWCKSHSCFIPSVCAVFKWQLLH